MALQDEFVGFRDVSKQRAASNKRVVQAPRPLQNRSASAEASEQRNAESFAGREIHLGGNSVGVAENHETIFRLPDSQQAIGLAVLAVIEQRFVAGQIFSGARES